MLLLSDMKKFIILLGLALFIFEPLVMQAQTTKSAAEPEKLVWLEWNEGYEKAVKSGKMVLVDAYTDWCGWCKKMDRDTYSNPAVIKKINAHFIPIKFNPEIEGKSYVIGQETFTGAQLYGLFTQGQSTGFPTTYFIFPAKKRILLDAGYKAPDGFLQVLETVIQESKK